MKEQKKPNRFRIVSIIAIAFILTASVSFINTDQSDSGSPTFNINIGTSLLTPAENFGSVDTPQDMTIMSTSSYLHSSFVNLWVRVNGSDPGYPYGGEDVPPSVGMGFFSTDYLTVSQYSWSQLNDTTLFPISCSILVITSLTNSTMNTLADQARLNHRLVGALVDDFRVGLESPSNVSGAYSAVHHEDANLTQGALNLYLVVYNENYFIETPYTWASIVNYFDGIQFWYVPPRTQLVMSGFYGYEDAFLEMKSWAPGKDFQLGIYLHWYNVGSYPYVLTYGQMAVAMKLVRNGTASGISILENFWIQHNPETSYLVRNFLVNEYDKNYATTITGLTATTSTNGMTVDSMVSNLIVDQQTSGTLFESLALQTISFAPGWTNPNAQNALTGAFQPIQSGNHFVAEPNAKYLIYDKAYSTVTYSTMQVISTPTTWQDKIINMNNLIYIPSNLTIKNCIIYMGEYLKLKLYNPYGPTWGLFLNSTGILRIDNSTIMPRNRYFPFNLALSNNFPTVGSREVYIHNSTIAGWAGNINTWGREYICDSVFYGAMPSDLVSQFGLYIQGTSSRCLHLTFNRNIVWNFDTYLSALVVYPDHLQAGGEWSFKDNIIAGFQTGLSISQSFATAVDFLNTTIFPTNVTWAGATPSTYHQYLLADGGTDEKAVTITTPFKFTSDELALNAILKDANRATIQSFSVTNGTLIKNNILMVKYNASGEVVYNPFPWSLNITTALSTSEAWHIGVSSFLRDPLNLKWYPITQNFTSNVILIDLGNTRNLDLQGDQYFIRLNREQFIGPGRQTSFADSQIWNIGAMNDGGATTCVISLSDYTTVFNLTYWLSNTLARWNAIASNPTTVTFTLSGLESGVRYRVYADGSLIENIIASNSGTITFTYSGPWSEHQFEVIKGQYGQAIVHLGAVLGVLMGLVIIVPIIATVAQIVNEKRKFKSEDVINMAIFIVIGVILLGVVYAILP